jgi:Xaa-Pro aminopeptidase
MSQRLRRLCRLEDRSDELLRLRMEKRPSEVRAIRKAVKGTKDILAQLDFKAARTELDLKRQLMVMMAEEGLEQAFEPIVSTDRNTAFPHYSAGRKRLGSLVLIDMGLRHKHYCSDLTRCFLLKRDQKKERQYEALQGVCHSIVDELPSLRTGKEVSAFAQRLMEKAGFPRMIHTIGHGLGLEVHEMPDLSARSKDRIAGAAIAIEPAFYLKGYGMRYEETIFFDGKRARIL